MFEQSFFYKIQISFDISPGNDRPLEDDDDADTEFPSEEPPRP
jgi:hypothetical protein